MRTTIRTTSFCAAIALLISGFAWADDDSDGRHGRNGKQLRKEALINPEAPDFTSIFNWGNKFNITMQLDTDGTTYASGMEYQEVEK